MRADAWVASAMTNINVYHFCVCFVRSLQFSSTHKSDWGLSCDHQYGPGTYVG